MPFVRARGLNFHYQDRPGPGVPLFLSHGLVAGNLASWYLGVVPRLKDRRVVTYDMRGHGRSDPAASGYTLATNAADLGALIDELAPEGQVDVGGHSYGGLVAMRYALSNPDRVRRLVVVEAPWPPTRLEEQRKLAFKTHREVFQVLPKKVQKYLLRRARGVVKAAQRAQDLADNTTLLDDLAGETDWPAAECEQFAAPTLALYGSDSPCRPDGSVLATVVRDGRFEVLEGGHDLPVSRAEAVAASLEAFLDA